MISKPESRSTMLVLLLAVSAQLIEARPAGDLVGDLKVLEKDVAAVATLTSPGDEPSLQAGCGVWQAGRIQSGHVLETVTKQYHYTECPWFCRQRKYCTAVQWDANKFECQLWYYRDTSLWTDWHRGFMSMLLCSEGATEDAGSLKEPKKGADLALQQDDDHSVMVEACDKWMGGKEFRGYTFKELPVQSTEECKEYCEENARCNAVTYAHARNRWMHHDLCWLKDVPAGTEPIGNGDCESLVPCGRDASSAAGNEM